jgi:hypothetical protein
VSGSLPLTWEGYREYDAQNPHVYYLLERFVLERVRRSSGRFSMGAVVERVRWELAVTTNDAGFKLNDRWTAFHARRFAVENPLYADRLEFRTSVADIGRWPGPLW